MLVWKVVVVASAAAKEYMCIILLLNLPILYGTSSYFLLAHSVISIESTSKQNSAISKYDIKHDSTLNLQFCTIFFFQVEQYNTLP